MRRLILDFIRRLAGTTHLRKEHHLLDDRVTALVAQSEQFSADHAALVANHAALVNEVANLKRSLAEKVEGRADFLIPDWWQQSFWELTVALAIRDHVRPGDVAYDVGSNAGALAMQMSRLAGPRGRICAFEASPRIIPRTQYNLVQAGCFNTTVFHRAVWHTSGAIVNIASGSHLNDRIADDTPGVAVTTVALDDFAAATGLHPTFIKMDIEGAEYDALLGMSRLLREVRPVLVLEQSPEDMRCHALLVAAGYAAVDLATYREIRTATDFPAASGVVNVLFVPSERARASPYFAGQEQLAATLSGEQFSHAADGSVSLPDPIPLSAGRYIVRADFSADGSDNEVFAGIEADGKVIFRYHTNTQFMAQSYRDWVIHLERPAQVSPYLRFLAGSDPSFIWRGVEILRLPAFDHQPVPVIS